MSNKPIPAIQERLNKILEQVATNQFALGHLNKYRYEIMELVHEVIGEDEPTDKMSIEMKIRNLLRAEQRKKLWKI